jgi:hypothetical protein
VVPCSRRSVDRYFQWLASGEGQTSPREGSLLVDDDGGTVARVSMLGGVDWSVVVLWLANRFDAQVDLTTSRGFTLTYSATSDLYVQLRPASRWSGGDKYVLPIPSTSGQRVTRFFPFDATAWTTLRALGTPDYPFAAALREARGLVFVGASANDLTFAGLRVDAYEPPCE